MMKPSYAEDGGPNFDPSANVIRCVSAMDLILRVVALIATFGSAIVMGTTNQTLPFATRIFRYRARYDDLPTFRFLVFANSLVTAYMILILPLSHFHVTAIAARSSRVILVIFDTVMLAFLTGSASAAGSVVYVAQKGSARANWYSVCRFFDNYCDRLFGSLIGSFVAVALLLILILMSAIVISR